MAEKEANCLLLWVHQGGRVDKGRLIQISGGRASGYCDAPDDCYRCPLMQREIASHPPGHANWVCPSCLRTVTQVAKETGKPIHLTGHYTEGQCQFIGCERPERIEYDADWASFLFANEDELENSMSGQSGWTAKDLVTRPRGHSRMLQLVIGDINT